MKSPLPVIHVVDDDAAFSLSVLFMLDGLGYEAIGHPTAESILQAAPPLGPSGGCLLLDIRMPRMSGLVLQRRLVAANSPFPVVFMTGHGDIDQAVQTDEDRRLGLPAKTVL